MTGEKETPFPLGQLVTSVPIAGRLLGLGKSAAYEAAKRGDIPTIRMGRKRPVPIRALEKRLGLEPGEFQKILREQEP